MKSEVPGTWAPEELYKTPNRPLDCSLCVYCTGSGALTAQCNVSLHTVPYLCEQFRGGSLLLKAACERKFHMSQFGTKWVTNKEMIRLWNSYTRTLTESAPLSQQDFRCHTLLKQSTVAWTDISTGFITKPWIGGKVTGEMKQVDKKVMISLQQAVEAPTFSRQSAYRWRRSQLHMATTLYPQEDSWYSFLLVVGSTPRHIVRLKGLGQLKNPMTSSGIEPAPFLLVVLCLSQLCYRVPLKWSRKFLLTNCGLGQQ
jgi:hypothetical protein